MIIDQFTKTLILGYYKYGERWTYVTSFFNVCSAHNTGAAFSFLADAAGWQRWFFMAIGIAAALVHHLDAQVARRAEAFRFSMAAILGGAIGNVIDRMMHGYVVIFSTSTSQGGTFPRSTWRTARSRSGRSA